nr:L-ascorbate oxidase-like [Coffea arabica]
MGNMVKPFLQGRRLLETFLVLCLLIYVMDVPSAAKAAGKVNKHVWDVRYNYVSPDCYKKLAITINGLVPGPTIHAVEGETVVVQVTNSLVTENVAIHWHGIRQIGTPWSDGTESVTQCAIQPGDTFVYQFVVDKAGTYMYHAHYGMQLGDGIYGMIRVKAAHKEPFSYSSEHEILLSDWYHKNAYEHAIDLSSEPFVWVGEPNSVLIQGRAFACNEPGTEAGQCKEPNRKCSPFSLNVRPGRTIRLRIGSLTALSTLSFEIEDHEMTVVEADGNYVEPFKVKHLYLYSGETYSVLIKTSPKKDRSRNYWMVAKVVSRESSTPSGLAILNYNFNPPLALPPTDPPAGPHWNDTSDRIDQSVAVKAHHAYLNPPPKKSDRTIILLNTQNKIEGKVRWSLNNVSLNLPHTPYLIALKENLSYVLDHKIPPDSYDVENYDIHSVPKNTEAHPSTGGLYRLKFNSIVDVILQNANTMTPNVSETHPWHLHGHDFWVLGYGRGKFNMATDTASYNLTNPIMKNSVPLHPYGWTALRFRADNPGVWAFHCHIEFHFFLGMAVVFEEGIDQVGELPDSIMGCGETKPFVKP